jgi:alpha-methylacyl-CoA racemase
LGGPLAGIRVIEIAGLGPGPFCGMLLADLGAEVIRVDRPISTAGWLIGSAGNDLMNRGKRTIAIDLKVDGAVDVVLELVSSSEALIEGYRPGVTERLGIGPADCLARNPALVYGRMTGWGREGPYAEMAGHDIDYIALSGALGSIGVSERPVPPLNLVGDFGGGGMLLALGVVAAIVSARETGEGQVVDAAMVDGSALLTVSHHGYMADGWWEPIRESNLLDGGAPFYTTYETSDGAHMAVGALEPQFFAELLKLLDLDAGSLPAQMDRSGWPQLRQALADRFVERTREEWSAHFEGSDACVAPVLSLDEAPRHHHNRARATFVEVEGVTQPAPAPRFSATPTATPSEPLPAGADTDRILMELGYSEEEIGTLRASGAVA